MIARFRFKSMALAISIITSLICVTPNADAWSNGGYSSDPENPDYGTHDWIAEMALALQERDATFLSITYHADFLLGTEAPDNPTYIGDPSKHHVYYRSDGSIQDDASAVRASDMYQSALSYIDSNDLRSAAFVIGAMTHYIADVGVFGHTMGSGTDWGAETHHSDYEKAIETLISSLDIPSGIPLHDKSAYQATMDLARVITFGSGDIKSNVWMDNNYLWTDPEFEASALASLYASVEAVAAAINHLLIEAFDVPAPPGPPLPEPTPPPEPDEVKVSPPGAPNNLSAVQRDNKVILSWSPPSTDGGAPITNYYIYRSEGESGFTHITTVDSKTFTWQDNSVIDGKIYSYKLRARNALGFSEYSETVTIAVQSFEVISEDTTSTYLYIVVASVAAALGLGGILRIKRKR